MEPHTGTDGGFRRLRSRSAGASTGILPSAPAQGERVARRRYVPAQENPAHIRAALGWETAPRGTAAPAAPAAHQRAPVPTQKPSFSAADTAPAPAPAPTPETPPRGVGVVVARRRTSATAGSAAQPTRADPAPAPPLTPSRSTNPLDFLYPQPAAKAPVPERKERTSDPPAGSAKSRSRSVPTRSTGLTDITNGRGTLDAPAAGRSVRRGSLTAGTPAAREVPVLPAPITFADSAKEIDCYATTSQSYGQPSPRGYSNGWSRTRMAPASTFSYADEVRGKAPAAAERENRRPEPQAPPRAALERRRSAAAVIAGKPSASNRDVDGKRQPSPTLRHGGASAPHPLPQPLAGPYMHSWQLPKNPITHTSWYLAPENPVPLHLPPKVTPPIGHPERYDRIPPDEVPSMRFPTAEPLFCKYSPFDLVMPLD